MDTTLQLPHTRHFFKVMMPGFSTRLLLPLGFCRYIIGEKSEKAVLKSCRGTWNVKVSRESEGGLQFKEGWRAFVEHHELCIGDFAVFEHKGDMVFHVLLFDSSSCEKDYPLSVASVHKSDKGTGLLPQGNNHNHAMHFKRQSPLEAATSCAPHSPHFITTIYESNMLPRKPYLNIPIEFAKSNDLIQKCSITLRCPLQKLWVVKLKLRKNKIYHQVYLTDGWHEFVVANQLKKRDVCIFELDSTKRIRSVVMDVHIFPA